MVDRKARDLYAEQLRHVASGRISVEEFNRRMPDGVARRDRGIRAVANEASWIGGRHSTGPLDGLVPVDQEGRRELAPLLAFLYSDEEYAWPTANLDMVDDAGSLARVLWPFFAGMLLASVWPVALWLGIAGSAYAFFAIDGPMWRALNAGFWPFASQATFDEARKRPRLLCGGRR